MICMFAVNPYILPTTQVCLYRSYHVRRVTKLFFSVPGELHSVANRTPGWFELALVYQNEDARRVGVCTQRASTVNLTEHLWRIKCEPLDRKCTDCVTTHFPDIARYGCGTQGSKKTLMDENIRQAQARAARPHPFLRKRTYVD